MIIYFLVFLLTIIVQLYPTKSNKRYLIKLIVAFIPLLLFGALRVDFGNDYESYQNIYYWVHNLSDLGEASDHAEYGYLLLNSLFPTWRSFIIGTSVIVYLSYIFLFYKFVPEKYAWIMTAILFLAGDKSVFFMFSGIRNALAICILLISVPYIRDRKYVKFTLLTILAASFHTSAFVMLPVAYIIGRNGHMNNREGVLWVSIMLFLQIIPLDMIIEQIAPFVNDSIDRYSGYIEKAEEVGDTRVAVVRLASAIFTCSIVYFMCTNSLNKSENTIGRLSLLFALSGLFGSLNMRMPQYYCMFFLLTFTLIFVKSERNVVKLTFILFALIYFAHAFFKVFMGNPNFPYTIYHSIID